MDLSSTWVRAALIGIVAERDPALAPVNPVIENKRLGAPHGDPQRETLDL
jgi:hypothetical protein